MNSFRIDRGTLRKPQRLADGRLRVDGVLTRSGVFEYRQPDGSIKREYRPPSEVFNTDSLATFADATVTDDHPPEMVSAENFKKYGVGMVSGDPRKDDDVLTATLVVSDANTIAKINAGKVALSCGYSVDMVETPGITPEGEHYDAIQTNIRGNHVAIVASGRAGNVARLRMDAAEQVDTSPVEDSMNLEQALAALAAANQDLGVAKERADKAEADLAAATARADGAEAGLAAEKTARLDAAAILPALVKARVDLQTRAAVVLGSDFNCDSSDADLKRAVVLKVDGDNLADDVHAAYLDGRFDSAVKRAKVGADSLAEARAVVKSDSTPVQSRDAARLAMINAIHNPSAE